MTKKWSVFADQGSETIAIEPRSKPTGKRPVIVDWPGFDNNGFSYWTNLKHAHLFKASPQMLEALKQAASMFRWYEELHRAKPDHEKANRNKVEAEKCEAAIAAAEGQP